MINSFVVRKWGGLLVVGFICVISFMVGEKFYGFLGSVVAFAIGLLLSLVIANLMLRNPFSMMLEGKGILAIDMSSTGILRPFIVSVQPPYIKGRFGGKDVNDVFDREAVMQLATPVENDTSAQMTKEGGIKIELSEKEYNAGRFALFHYPCLIWNSQINSIITKDWFSEKEKGAFAEHGILYLNRRMEELTTVVRDFGRAVVELLKPDSNFLKSKWFIIVLVIGLIVLAVLFAPAIFDQLKSAFAGGGGGGGVVETVTGTIDSVTPR